MPFRPRLEMAVLILAGCSAEVGGLSVMGPITPDGDATDLDAKWIAPRCGDLEQRGLACRSGFCWEHPLPQGMDLNDAASSGPRVFAVGDAGTILVREGDRAWIEESNTEEDLLFVSSAGGDVWAGARALLLRRTDMGWQDVPLPSGGEVHALVAVPGAVFVALQGPISRGVYRLADGSWRKLRGGTSSPEALWACDRGWAWVSDGEAIHVASTSSVSPGRLRLPYATSGARLWNDACGLASVHYTHDGELVRWTLSGDTSLLEALSRIIDIDGRAGRVCALADRPDTWSDEVLCLAGGAVERSFLRGPGAYGIYPGELRALAVDEAGDVHVFGAQGRTIRIRRGEIIEDNRALERWVWTVASASEDELWVRRSVSYSSWIESWSGGEHCASASLDSGLPIFPAGPGEVWWAAASRVGRCGSEMQVEAPPLVSIWSPGADELWGIDGKGNVARLHAGSWSTTSTGDVRPRVLWGSSPASVFAAGDGIAHWDGSAWTSQLEPGETDVHDLVGTGPRDVWAAGHELLHFNGSAWTKVDGPPEVTGPLHAVWMSGPGRPLVGVSGVEQDRLFRMEADGSWSRVRGLGGAPLSISGAPAYARAGHRGGILRYCEP